MASTRAPARPRTFSGLLCLRTVEFASPDGLFVRARGTTDGDDDVVLVGGLGHLLPGELVRADGRWDTHEQYGEQLRVDHAVPAALDEPEAVRAFVATTAGVGGAAAAALAGEGPPPERSRGPSLFDQGQAPPAAAIADAGLPADAAPDAVLARIDADPARAFRAAGLPRARVGTAAGDWKERRRTHALRALLAAHGLDRVVAHVARALGPTAAARLREDPHLLCERFGVPLAVADAMARTLGLAVAPGRRAQAAIVHVLRAATADGHTALPTYLALGRAAGLVGTPDADGAAAGAAALDDRAALAALAGRGLVAVARGGSSSACSPSRRRASRAGCAAWPGGGARSATRAPPAGPRPRART
jgi:exodeoxyribonuclease V alpha subunit